MSNSSIESALFYGCLVGAAATTQLGGSTIPDPELILRKC
jgi:hypothetical protein